MDLKNEKDLCAKKRILVVCTTDSMIWNFLVPHIKWLEGKGFIVECACSKTGFYFDELRKENNIILHEIPFERSPFKTANIYAYKQLSSLINEGKFDIVYCHEPVGGALGRLAGKHNGKYVIYLAHGFHFFKKAPIKHWLMYFMFEYCLAFFTDAIVTICNEDYENSQKLHVKKRYQIPGIGIDFLKYDLIDKNEKRNQLRKFLGISEDEYVLITVGELSVRKNQVAILEALNIIQNPKIKLVICGEGDQVDMLKKKICEYGLEEQVFMLGFRKDIPEILSIADCFVFPSLWEGLGLAALEAMYMNLPVIASNRQGIKDYVVNGQTGFLFEPDDYYELSECIKRLSDKDLRVEMGIKTKEVAKFYSIDNSLNALEEVYKAECIV